MLLLVDGAEIPVVVDPAFTLGGWDAKEVRGVIETQIQWQSAVFLPAGLATELLHARPYQTRTLRPNKKLSSGRRPCWLCSQERKGGGRLLQRGVRPGRGQV